TRSGADWVRRPSSCGSCLLLGQLSAPGQLIVRVTTAVCVRPPLVPLIVSVNVPVRALREVLIDRVEVEAAGLGENEALVREGNPLTLRLTEPVKPLPGVIVTVYVVPAPWVTVWLEGVALRVKLAGACTTRVTCVVCVSEPLVPVIVSG